jgi:hypothetical protein
MLIQVNYTINIFYEGLDKVRGDILEEITHIIEIGRPK